MRDPGTVPVSGARCVPHVGEGSRRSERAPGTRGASWATAEAARAAAAVMGAGSARHYALVAP